MVSRTDITARRRAIVSMELVIAMGILAATLLPLAYSFVQEQRVARAYYIRAIAIELVDGEMEILTAGSWHAYAKGRHTYPVQAAAARNLPPGEFILTVGADQLRLEWRPAGLNQGGVVSRTAALRPERGAGQ
jgi:hypothetical protein